MSGPTADSRPNRPPQFGLRTLLLVMMACAVLAALSRWMSPIALVGVVLLAVSVALHVAGNAIGTKLRQLGDRPPPEAAPRPFESASPQPHQFAPVTRLSQRYSLGWLNVVATVLGVLSGGVGGGIWSWVSSRNPAGPLQIAVGAVAFAALGGMAAFATAAFMQVLFGALWQALHPPAGELRRDVTKM